MTVDVGGTLGVVTTVLYGLQALAAGLKNIPQAWGKGQTSGPGSGWYKFWNAVASFPGNPAGGNPQAPK